MRFQVSYQETEKISISKLAFTVSALILKEYVSVPTQR